MNRPALDTQTQLKRGARTRDRGCALRVVGARPEGRAVEEVAEHAPHWKLLFHETNPHRNQSGADFYAFARESQGPHLEPCGGLAPSSPNETEAPHVSGQVP